MRELYFIVLLLTGGVCLGFALHATTLALQSRQRRYLYLGALALLEAAYCVVTYEYFRATAPAAALPWGRAICIFTPSIVWLFAQLVSDLLSLRERWFVRLQQVNLALTILFSLLVVGDAAFGTHLALTGVVYTDLGSLHRHRLEFGLLGELWLGWVSIVFTLCAVLLVRGYRTRRYLLPMVLGCVAYFLATISDFGILLGFYDTYFVQHIGFFALALGCWRVVSGRYEKSLDELRAALVSLEAQRRNLLVSAPVMQHQKLEAIGTFAAGVAHEINNPVQGIMNYGQLLMKRLEAGSESRQFAEEIVAECRRVAEIIHALLSFSRADHKDFGSMTVRELIDDTLKLTRSSLASHAIRLEVDVAEGLPVVQGSAQQIRQVLMNLLTNARDALDARDPQRHEDKVIRVEAKGEERAGEMWLVIDVVDNADGIDAKLCSRIFDPFFTTKAPGQGTGLGLAISQGIVTARGGRLGFDTAPGEGSRFRLEVAIDALAPDSSRRSPAVGDGAF